MSQPDHITALNISLPHREDLPKNVQKYLNKCDEKLGMVPNVLLAYTQNIDQFDAFSTFYNTIMFGKSSSLTPLEKEMIAVVVSSRNHCYYCLVAHGAAVREYSENPILGELMVMNYKAATLSKRHRAMLDFAVKLTDTVDSIGETERQVLRDAGFNEQDIWDIANVTGFYNMTNRVASAVDMQPNIEYHKQNR